MKLWKNFQFNDIGQWDNTIVSRIHNFSYKSNAMTRIETEEKMKFVNTFL